jgi:hypothetical protein
MFLLKKVKKEAVIKIPIPAAVMLASMGAAEPCAL